MDHHEVHHVEYTSEYGPIQSNPPSSRTPGWIWIIMIIVFVVIIAIVIIVAINAGKDQPPNNGTACSTNSDCTSGNCSNMLCQVAGVTSGTAGALCVPGATSGGGSCDAGLSCVTLTPTSANGTCTASS